MAGEKQQFNLPKEEEKILEFWEKNKIFEKSIAQRKNARRFVFYDGPPFATGLPHYGHILASTIKDAVPRYWTMRGFRVDRRWGWDCHGLPIETLVEQELGIAGRKEIQKLGIKKFNEAARSKVLAYTGEWRKTVRRIGRFVDFENAYTTMNPSYMESVWWAFAALYKKGLAYRDSRTSLFCPRCETPLSNFEIAMDNSYRDQEDDSVYVKFPLLGEKNESLLVWTTTPWTLPGNAAVAVNPRMEYTKFKIGGEFLWAVAPPPLKAGESMQIAEKCSGKSLLGKKYQAPFELAKDPGAYRVVGAEFVSSQEGTGLVHIAPAFGEEDFVLGKKEGLPLLETLDDTGRFSHSDPELKFLWGKKTAEANPLIIEYLRDRNTLWKVEKVLHRYPICWRCRTPLIYKVQPAWFVNIAKLRPDMLAANRKIDWHPEYLKQGRFGKGLETAPDWNVSRSRFWGTPLPIWECIKCKKIQVIGSREEFHQKSGGPRNKYLLMRHGEAENNVKMVYNSAWPEIKKYHLTLKGRTQIQRAAHKLKKEKIDFIISSPFTRTQETAEIVGRVLGVKIHFDERLREMFWGSLHDAPAKVGDNFFPNIKENFTRAAPGGETLSDIRGRVFSVVKDLERKYSEKKILIVSHGDPLWMLAGALLGLSNNEALTSLRADYPAFGAPRTVPYKIVPRNETGELDFHLPYVDEITLRCDCGGEAKRIPDVFDCWFESGSMPFATAHFPFAFAQSQKSKVKSQNYTKLIRKLDFPADFISEYIAQTRGWFYTLHVLASGLFGKQAFKHAVTTGTILSEKGEKLSKSRQNFPDPWILFNRYGVDAMRYYLMASPVMLADNLNFSEKEVGEIYKKYSLIALNILNFYILYRDQIKKNKIVSSKHVLDQWIISRLHSTIREVTEGFDKYEIVKATRPLLDFIQDFSQWYLRRSRERIKSDTADGQAALRTFSRVLYDLARIMAPVTPFLAEIIYRGLGKMRKISVHLEDWPRAEKKFIKRDLEGKMSEVRQIASDALRMRAEAGIRVRQPLQELGIRNQELGKNPELLNLIKEEVNVKKITFGKEMRLDTTITPELREEGIAREFIRNVQEMRRDLGLKPGQAVRIQISGDQKLEAAISRREKKIKKDANASGIKIGGKKIYDAEREFEFEGTKIWIGISRI